MPTYEYECLKCGLRFEKFQNMADKPLKTCPNCDSTVRRLIGTGAAVIVKGPGSRASNPGRLGTRCSQDRPCCGRDVPCDTPPCEK